MKLINCWVLSLLLAVTSVSSIPIYGQESQNSQTNYFLHTIEKGQSLYSIASMYKVSQADIIALNPGCEEKIYAGQTLKIPQPAPLPKEKDQTGQRFHTIQPRETLYQLTVKYNVSAQAICDANPGLSAQNFKIGEVIKIPLTEKTKESQNTVKENPLTARPTVESRCKEMHKVKRKETVFSVSRQYGISEQELIDANPELKQGMKKGDWLCIPYPKTFSSQPSVKETQPVPQSNTELFNASKKLYKKYSPIKAAVILPFMLEGGDKGEVSRMVEYYEGFLIAIDSLKRNGVSIDLYTYDSGNSAASMKNILAKKEMQDMNIIFGPYHTNQVKLLADFAKKHGILLVIPFSSKCEEVFSNPFVYQINTPQSYLYSEVYEHFIRKFGHANIIIAESTDSDKEKAEFIKGLKQELKNKHIPYKVINAGTTQANLKAAVDPSQENIFVPTSGSNITLIKFLPQLTQLVRENPDYKVHLFGYPEWQTYTKDHLANFYELDTYFYTSFYTNNLFPQAISFTTSYRKLYGKDMAERYPKFGMLGFDTAYFFLYGLSKYGSDFSDDLGKINVTPIQTGFKFERVNNWGGFINKKVFFVHFTKDFELIKLDFE